MPGPFGLGQLLRGRDGEKPSEMVPLEPAEAAAAPAINAVEIEFAAYAEDCRLFGFYRLAAERLTDALNAERQFDLTDVLVVRLADGVAYQERSLTVNHEELLAIRAAGPRGNAARRSRRRPSPVTLRSGPYVIHGYVHALPGADPVAEVRRKRAMVPLTDSWIEYRSMGTEHRARAGTIIVNRDLVDWVRPSRDEEVWLPNLPVESKPNPLAKDLTGYIRTNDEDDET